ncbi:hypothetical protein XpiCFBP4643_05640 [Xanthomonas pisi]|uniref:DUF4189 domain-containing protein n=2 Tax=Xanthomonas pisi TaxID=56457 RepID=A0A2S7D5D7_9XANT|nr:hypothetical protein XpiCFBP4643_05640 [Xanthomonas pisi]
MKAFGARELIVLHVILFGTLANFTVIAQAACPIGTSAGSAVCGPSAGSSSNYNGSREISPPRTVPTGRWIKTWGAIASSPSSGGGSSVGKFSKAEAEREALEHCSEQGVSDCKVALTYRNQCVAFAFPLSGKGGNSIDTGKTIAIASRDAKDKCESGAGSDAKCQIIYSAYSEPFFERY